MMPRQLQFLKMMRSREISEESHQDKSSNANIEDLFDSCRIQVSPKFYKAIFYFPFGLILLLVRLIAGTIGILILSLLPRTSPKWSTVLKGLCKIWGLVLDIDNKYYDENAKLLVANHVSIWDRLAVNVMSPCCSISKDREIENDSVSFWKEVDFTFARDMTNDEISALQMSIESSPVPILHFPEGTTTNGKFGLLKFHPAVFSLNVPIQPILIRVRMQSFMTISPSILSSNALTDILWTFMIPSTFIHLKTLPSMVKLPDETVTEFSKRVQQTMARAMALTPTVFTSGDKAELAKRLQTANEAVPSTIATDVFATGQSSNLHTSKYSSINPNITLSMNMAAATFGRTPKERMLSYQERRTILLETARRKYLEKRNLV